MVCVEFVKSTYCLVTGASRGIGKAIALELAHRCTDELTIVLLARSLADLNETKSLILNINKKANVIVESVDLQTVTKENFEKIINESTLGQKFENAIIFHNAGQLGNVKDCSELSNADEWNKYYCTNLFSTITLNSVFLNVIKPLVNKICVINITSLCGRMPFKTLAMYGSVKAARDMFFKVLAVEDVGVNVLNYSPGMVDTAMIKELFSHMDNMTDNTESPTILSTDQTIKKMFKLLTDGAYKSGDIVDYYD